MERAITGLDETTGLGSQTVDRLLLTAAIDFTCRISRIFRQTEEGKAALRAEPPPPDEE